MKDAGRIEKCPDCGKDTERLYTASRNSEFREYYDEAFNTTISCRSQEKRLMKAHKKVYMDETPGYYNPHLVEARKRYKKKPLYFIPK